jgi:hypothetical protein
MGELTHAGDPGSDACYMRKPKSIRERNLNMPPSLGSGQSLQPGHSLSSPNGLYSLWMQTDGNVVLYNGQNDNPAQARWATHTGPGQFTPSELTMQGDGNLVLYDTSNQARWASGTSRQNGAILEVQNDGNVVVYSADSTTESPDGALWATGTGTGFLPPSTPAPGTLSGPGFSTGGRIPAEEEGGDEEGGEEPVDIR